MSKAHGAIKLLFLGQCIAGGGNGIGEANSYPHLVQQMLSAQFPTLRFELKFRWLSHPTGLKALLASYLPEQPDIIFISLPAIFASIPFRINSLYLISPDVMRIARAFVEVIEARLRKDSALATLFSKRHTLQPTVKCPPVTCDEYRQLIEEALNFCQQASPCRLILMGPGGFNEDTESEELKSPEQCEAINQMILAIGRRLNLPVVNAHDWMTGQGGKVFLPGDHRWNQLGHEVMAREIQAVVAAQVKALKVREA